MNIIDLRTMREACAPPASVVCLGNFDGVHIGHAALIQETLAKKEQLSKDHAEIAACACFFRTLTSDYLRDTPTPRLTTFDEKLSLFATSGLDYAFVIDFEEVGGLSPDIFVEQILKASFHCVFAVCGFNFRFGKQASGDADRLKSLMDNAASIVHPVIVGGKTVSSSLLRQLIADGDVHLVPALLGRPYSLNVDVLHGKALGRTLGIPTINQCFPQKLAVPKRGIYITKTQIGDVEYPSVTNVGIRPSVEDGDFLNCETHILDFDGDLYGKRLRVQFIHRLRDEMKFENVNALTAQIQADIKAAKAYYKEA